MKTQKPTLDALLKLVENPLRRLILSKLAEEELYPLQLSKELRVSQQAVSKHLKVLEKAGLVESHSMDSHAGPPRLYYRPTKHFAINISFGPSLFETEMHDLGGFFHKLDGKTEEAPGFHTPEEEPTHLYERMRALDAQMEQLSRQRCELFLKRCRVMGRLRRLGYEGRVEERY